jgi:hypothetical protein
MAMPSKFIMIISVSKMLLILAPSSVRCREFKIIPYRIDKFTLNRPIPSVEREEKPRYLVAAWHIQATRFQNS